MDAVLAILPDGLGISAALVLIVASFFTSALTAAFGVGGGVAMLALLGIFLPVAALIPVHGAIQLGSTSGRAWHQRAHVRHNILRPFVLGSLAGAVVGLFVVVQLPDAILKPALGLFVIAMTWWTVPGLERLRGLGLSLASGVLAVLSMIFGATGPLLSAMFAQLMPNDRRALVATHGAGMAIHHGLKVVVFTAVGFAFAAWLPLIALMVATGFLGTIYGTRMLDRLPEDSFRRWFKIGITVLALDMLRQGLTGLF